MLQFFTYIYIVVLFKIKYKYIISLNDMVHPKTCLGDKKLELNFI